ncbi:MAG: GGDEF domain-containing protein [Eubacteriales bacterium]
MISEYNFKLLMYYISIILSIIIIVPLLIIATTTILLTLDNTAKVEDGTISLMEYDFTQNIALSLQGEFLSYENIFLTDEIIDSTILHDPTYITLPTADLQKSLTTATYQLQVALNVDHVMTNDVVLCIPLVHESVTVYVNGVKVERKPFDSSWGGSTQISYYSLKEQMNPDFTYQEILLSTNHNEGDSDLFKRDISISTEKNYLDFYKTTVILQVFLLGMMSISIIIAIVYFLFDPKNATLTYLNIFDTLLMTHILFNMTFVPNILFSMINNTTYGDLLFRKIELFALVFAAFICYSLNKTLFDPAQKFPKRCDQFITLFYTSIAIAVTFKPTFPSGIGLYFLASLPILTASASSYKFYRLCKQEDPGKFLKVFYIRMLFINLIILLDIVTINQVSLLRNLVLFGYLIIFSIHLGLRGIEYRRPFLVIQRLNSKLEQMVEDRTLELKKANEELKIKSETDALTGIYNRFIFENRLQLFTEELNLSNSTIQTLHLCIFDVDNFKRINDTYGHIVGDEQLISLANTTTSLLPKDVLFARIGGEEFALLFKDYADDKVLSTVEDIRSSLEALALASKERTTSSFGITKATSGTTRKAFYIQADNCLYYSKTHGKNMIHTDFHTMS